MFYFNLNKKKKRKEKVYKLYRNKNSITITNGKIYRCVRIEFEEKRKKEKKRKFKRFRKEQHFKHLSNFLHLNFTKKPMPKLFHVCLNFHPSYPLYVYPFLSSFPFILRHQTIGTFTNFRDINFLTSLSLFQTMNTLHHHWNSRKINFKSKFSKIKISPFYKRRKEN